MYFQWNPKKYGCDDMGTYHVLYFTPTINVCICCCGCCYSLSDRFDGSDTIHDSLNFNSFAECHCLFLTVDTHTGSANKSKIKKEYICSSGFINN